MDDEVAEIFRAGRSGIARAFFRLAGEPFTLAA
jgi:hypothetical protein